MEILIYFTFYLLKKAFVGVGKNSCFWNHVVLLNFGENQKNFGN